MPPGERHCIGKTLASSRPPGAICLVSTPLTPGWLRTLDVPIRRGRFHVLAVVCTIVLSMLFALAGRGFSSVRLWSFAAARNGRASSCRPPFRPRATASVSKPTPSLTVARPRSRAAASGCPSRRSSHSSPSAAGVCPATAPTSRSTFAISPRRLTACASNGSSSRNPSGNRPPATTKSSFTGHADSRHSGRQNGDAGRLFARGPRGVRAFDDHHDGPGYSIYTGGYPTSMVAVNNQQRGLTIRGWMVRLVAEDGTHPRRERFEPDLRGHRRQPVPTRGPARAFRLRVRARRHRSRRPAKTGRVVASPT